MQYSALNLQIIYETLNTSYIDRLWCLCHMKIKYVYILII